jgi:hypothetical protein
MTHKFYCTAINVAVWHPAKAKKADLYFPGESGFRADAVQGKTRGAKINNR